MAERTSGRGIVCGPQPETGGNMKYHVSYIEDPSQDVDIEADDLNLGEQTVSFYKDPKGTSFVKTIAILTLVPGMKIIGDDKVVLAEELPIAA
jgi:hypothetical protein